MKGQFLKGRTEQDRRSPSLQPDTKGDSWSHTELDLNPTSSKYDLFSLGVNCLSFGYLPQIPHFQNKGNNTYRSFVDRQETI